MAGRPVVLLRSAQPQRRVHFVLQALLLVCVRVPGSLAFHAGAGVGRGVTASFGLRGGPNARPAGGHPQQSLDDIARAHSRRARRNSILPQVDGVGARLEPHMTRLHSRAREAIRGGRLDVARELYTTILYRLPAHAEISPATRERTYLLYALHEQRSNHIQQARSIFNQGIVRFPNSTKLLVALALMESKHGDLSKARKLVRKAALRDPKRCAAVARWKIFQMENDGGVPALCL